VPAGRESDARKFYQGILGIPEAMKPPYLAAPGGCWFDDGELKIHPAVRKEFRAGTKGSSGLIVDDLAGLEATSIRAGYPVAHDQDTFLTRATC
jgi:hypothetical protein